MHVQAQIVQVFEGKSLSMFAPEAKWFERTRQPDTHEIGQPHSVLPNPPDRGRVPSICAVKPASRGVEQTSLSLPATPNPSVSFHQYGLPAICYLSLNTAVTGLWSEF